MKITRIYTDGDGETHFDEIDEPDVEFRSGGAYTRQIDTYGVAFRATIAAPAWRLNPGRVLAAVKAEHKACRTPKRPYTARRFDKIWEHSV